MKARLDCFRDIAELANGNGVNDWCLCDDHLLSTLAIGFLNSPSFLSVDM